MSLFSLAVIRIGIDPTAFHIGPVAIHWYGLFYVVAIIVGVEIARRYVMTFGADEDELWGFLPWAIGAGLLGGRLYYVVQNRQEYYLSNPEHILAAWEGGMAFFGAIGAVLITAVIYARLHKISLLPMLDVAAIFAAVGQPIGRIGNIINGDILGYQTSLPWGTAYTHPDSFAPQLGVAYQPGAAYEMIANFVLIGFLWLVLRRIRWPGLSASLYLIGYSVTQFIVFFGRSNSIAAFGLKQAQLTAIVTFVFSMILIAITYRLFRKQTAHEAEPDPEVVSPSA